MNRAASLAGIDRSAIVDALEQAGVREDIVSLFATGDHIDKRAWQDLTHDCPRQARFAAEAVHDTARSLSGPTYRLYMALDDWTTELEKTEAAWQEERRADLALAGRGWAE